MSLVDRPEVLEQGRVGLSPLSRVAGTGSISTLHMNDEEVLAAAERRKVPVGFRAMQEAVSAAVERVAAAEARRVERELRDFGECLWTARDVIVVVSDGHTLKVKETQ